MFCRNATERGWSGLGCDYLYVRYRFRLDGRCISPAQSIIVRKSANILTAMVWSEATLTDTMQRLLSFTNAFRENYSMRLVNVSEMDILGDAMCSNFQAANPGAKYWRYIESGKVVITPKGMLSLLVDLAEMLQRQLVSASLHLTTQIFTFIFRKAAYWWGMKWVTNMCVKNDYQPSSSAEARSTSTWAQSLMKSTLTTWRKANRDLWRLHCFKKQRYRK